MWHRPLVSMLVVLLITSCGDEREKRDEDPRPTVRIPHHRPGAPLDLAEVTKLLPNVEHARVLSSPARRIPEQRVVAEYCHDAGPLRAHADALAATVGERWKDVSIRQVRDRWMIRASRDGYVLRASVAPGTKPGCSGTDAVLVRLLVFQPMGAGGFGRGLHKS